MGDRSTIARSILVALTLVFTIWAGSAWADAEMKLAGFADVPDATLSLPLDPGATPVTINLKFGVPSLTIPVEIAHSTHIESDTGRPVTITDGDRVTVEANVVQGVLRADRKSTRLNSSHIQKSRMPSSA